MTQRVEQGEKKPEIKIIPAGYAWGYNTSNVAGEVGELQIDVFSMRGKVGETVRGSKRHRYWSRQRRDKGVL